MRDRLEYHYQRSEVLGAAILQASALRNVIPCTVVDHSFGGTHFPHLPGGIQ